MVVVSEDVRNVVNRIFLVGIAYQGRIPNMYGQIVSAFEKLDRSIVNINASSVRSAPFAWKRDKVLVLRVGTFMFSYSKVIQHNGEPLVIVHEVMENGQIVTEIENRIKTIIRETIKQYIRSNLL